MNHYLIYQLQCQIVVKDLSKQGILQAYMTGGSKVPMIIQSRLKSSICKQHKFFIHFKNEDLNQQSIKMLTVTNTSKGLDCNIKEVMLEKLTHSILKMEYINDSIFVFDQNLTIKKYVMEQTRDQLKCVLETKLLEEASFA